MAELAWGDKYAWAWRRSTTNTRSCSTRSGNSSGDGAICAPARWRAPKQAVPPRQAFCRRRGDDARGKISGLALHMANTSADGEVKRSPPATARAASQ